MSNPQITIFPTEGEFACFTAAAKVAGVPLLTWVRIALRERAAPEIRSIGRAYRDTNELLEEHLP